MIDATNETSDTADRWRLSLHEAAHCVVAVALGDEPKPVVVFPDGGLSYGGFFLAPVPDAIVRAAGREAEELATRFLPPNCGDVAADVEATGVPLSIPPSDDETRRHEGVCKRTAAVASDDRMIAEWAITGHEREPKTWAGRVEWVHYQARGVVADNVDSIVAIARRLFITGIVTRFELRLFFPSDGEAVAKTAVEAA
jgi:hypothetical protein